MSIGTPLSPSATRVLLLGSGELGKEVAIELQRLGCEVIACDRYASAPAMQVAHRSHVLSMLDGEALRAVIAEEQPDLVVPEIEAIATDVLVELEAEGLHVVPTARAAHLTMNREGIRRFAAEDLGLPTSPYRFVSSADELRGSARRAGTARGVEADHVLERQGAERGAVARRRRGSVDVRAGGRPGRRGPLHRRGVRRLRRRADPVDGVRRERHPVLRARSGTCRSTATTASPGSPRRSPNRCSPGRSRWRPRWSRGSAGTASSVSSCSAPATRSSSPRSARARTTPAW